jgi:hypothetical protein
VGDYHWYDDLRTPVDIPDLDPSLRNYYTIEELAQLPDEVVPFTVRMRVAPTSSSQGRGDIAALQAGDA